MSVIKQKNDLYSKLDSICDELRKTMDPTEYRNYILGFIFYKFLSEKFLKKADEALENDDIKYMELQNNNPKHQKSLEYVNEYLLDDLGYFIKKEYLFSSWIEKIANDEYVIPLIEESFRELENSSKGTSSNNPFSHLFDDINLTSNKLGNTEKQKEISVKHVLNNLAQIDFSLDDSKIDILGDAYEHLIANFAKDAGKKAGEFYTPQEVSKILAKIVTCGKTKIQNAYDPTCGSGSLLLQITKLVEVPKIYGQEMKDTTYNLARMNMFLSGRKFHEFDIKCQDTIFHPEHMDVVEKIKGFDAIVANPPFSLPWNPDATLETDPRFIGYGKLAPKSKMDYAFIQHMLYCLSENGVMATVVPHGVLFRGAAEETIRKYIVDNKNWLDAVIGLPANIFYGTSIPSCIMVFKKNRRRDAKVLFIEASREFEKGKNQNILTDENIEKIINTYKDRKEIEKYSREVSLDEIKENDFNLNITRYIDTFEDEEEIDIDAINLELEKINKEILETEKQIQSMISELVETGGNKDE